MEFKELLFSLMRVGLPSGELKREMFDFHNSMVGKSQYITKAENGRTMCGSCIQRVKSNVFKYYHYEYEPKFSEFIFLNRFGVNNMPMYGVNKKR